MSKQESDNMPIDPELSKLGEGEGYAEGDIEYQQAVAQYTRLLEIIDLELKGGTATVAHTEARPLVMRAIELTKEILTNEIRGDIDTLALEREREDLDIKIAQHFLAMRHQSIVAKSAGLGTDHIDLSQMVIPDNWQHNPQ